MTNSFLKSSSIYNRNPFNITILILLLFTPFSSVSSDDHKPNASITKDALETGNEISDILAANPKEKAPIFNGKVSPLEQEVILNIPEPIQIESKSVPLAQGITTNVLSTTPPVIIPETSTQLVAPEIPDAISTSIKAQPIVVEKTPNTPKEIKTEIVPESIIPIPVELEAKPNIEKTTDLESTPISPTQELSINIPDLIRSDNVPSQIVKIVPFSIQDAILSAVQNNPDIDMAREREKRAGYSVQEAEAKFYPTLEFKTQAGWRYINPYPGNESGEGDHSTEASATLLLKQLVFDGFTSISEVKRNKQIEKTTKIENEILIEEITSETISHYFKILQFQETTREATLFINAMEIIMEKLTVMQEIGAASMIELDFSKARLASAKSANINARSSLKDAISNLEFLVGPLENFSTEQPYDLEKLDLKPLAYYFESSKTNNSQIRLNLSMQSSARFKIDSAKGNFYPTVNVVIEGKSGYNEFGGQGTKSDSSVLLQANYLIYDAGKRQAGLNKANSKYREQEILSRQYRRELNKGIKLDYNQVSSIKQTLVSINDEIDANIKLQTLNRENLALGEIKIIELIEVEERLFNSRATKHQKVSDFYINYYNLMTKSGLLKDAILSDRNEH